GQRRHRSLLRKMFLARQVSGTQKKLNQSTPRMANRRRRCRKNLSPGIPAVIFFFPNRSATQRANQKN
ncbi:MAG: hypothetical protein PVI55_15110, partial [Desulfobacterales bacterium]